MPVELFVVELTKDVRIGHFCLLSINYGLGTTNERGLRLLEFAEMNNLVFTNTLYPHKLSRRWTWTSPNGSIKNQIDYILIQKKYVSSVQTNKTRSFPGAVVGSDHNLVMMNIKLKLRRLQKKKPCRIKYNIELLKNPIYKQNFEVAIGGKFGPLLLLDDMQEMTDGFTEGMN